MISEDELDHWEFDYQQAYKHGHVVSPGGPLTLIREYRALLRDHLAIIRRLEREEWVRVHKDATDTELDAAESARERYPRRSMEVMKYLIETGGDYDTHGSDTTGMWLNSYAPARNALMRRGFVRDSERRVVNERGNKAIIWVPTQAGLQWYQQAQQILDVKGEL